MKTVYCPVIDGQIDGTTCTEIVDVADGLINKRIFELQVARRYRRGGLIWRTLFVSKSPTTVA